MSYFPSRLMPLTPKENSPLASDLENNVRLSADDYNLHDEEILAIEQFLGPTAGFAGLGIPDTLPNLRVFQGGLSPKAGGSNVLLDPAQGNIFNVIAQMIDIVNNMTEFRGQASSSGYIHSGQRMVLPENAHASFLTATPAPMDTTINVSSTEGFPNRGVISILNDVQQATKVRSTGDFFQNVRGGTTTVEWIRYTDKTQTAFLNCERGFLDTNAGPHAGEFNSPRSSRSNRNSRDFCVLMDGIEIDVCDREWPWWRQKTRFSMPFFGISGFLRDLKMFIRRYGPRFPLNAGRDPSSAATVLDVARDLGLLTFRDGTPFLLSDSRQHRNSRVLRWQEASRYVNGLRDNDAVTEETITDKFIIGHVPVFLGRMAVHHSISAITRTTKLNVDAINIVQTADGRLFGFMQDFANRDRTLQSVLNYHAYFIAPPLNTTVGNNQ